MSQNSLTLTCQQSGTQFTDKVNEALDSVDSCHAGPDEPTFDLANGKLWLNTSASDYVLNMYIGTASSGTWFPLFNYDGTNFQSEHAQEADVLTTPRNLSLQGDATGTFANFDGSGNLSATIDVNTSAKLDVARTISLSGDLAGSITFDGSADKTLTATIQADSIDLAMMTDNSVDTAEIVDNAVTLDKLQTLTKGDVIVGDDSGNPAVINGTTDQVLTTLSTGNVGWESAPKGLGGVEVFTANGTFNWSNAGSPSTVWITAIGGGGWGGYSSGYSTVLGGSGGGGETRIATITGLDGNLTITIGTTTKDNNNYNTSFTPTHTKIVRTGFTTIEAKTGSSASGSSNAAGGSGGAGGTGFAGTPGNKYVNNALDGVGPGHPIIFGAPNRHSGHRGTGGQGHDNYYPQDNGSVGYAGSDGLVIIEY